MELCNVQFLQKAATKVLHNALCTFTFSLQSFTIFFRINAFINVYYKFFDVYHIYEINRLQQIQNCLTRTVVKAPKSSLVTPILRSLHCLKINERIEYKLLSLTYKVLTTSQPDYLHNLIYVQSSGRTRSSSVLLSP